MSMWSRLRVALLTATAAAATLQLGGCLKLNWDTVYQLVAIANIIE